MADSKASIQKSFLLGESVFLTGATGFVGKAVLELILRDHYPYLKHIYLLVRSNKSNTINQRLQTVMSNKIFTNLQDTMGLDNYWSMVQSKVIPIQGDISQPGLGISPSDLEELKRNANYVIHCAATTDFNEIIPNSFQLNVNGTQSVLDLCDQLERCEGFQHVSTAYTNSNLPNGSHIMERVYPMGVNDAFTLINSIPKMSQAEIEELTKKVLQVYPNTYAFTKSLAEHSILYWVEFMRQREINLGTPAWPVSIVRPTVVTSAAEFPLPGWVDGVSACNGIALYMGLGVLDTIPGEVDNVIDLVPVDYLAHIMVKACAVMTPPGTQFTLPYSSDSNSDPKLPIYPPIYHASSSKCNPIKWVDFGIWVVEGWKKLPPLKKQLFSPNFHKYKTEIVNSAALTFRNHIRFDLLSFVTMLKDPNQSKKLMMLKAKLQLLYHCFNHFMTNSWTFGDDNVHHLDYLMELETYSDRVISKPFPLTKMSAISWERYVYQFVYGMYYFVLNESSSVRLPDVISGWECTLRKVNPLPNHGHHIVSPTIVPNQHLTKVENTIINKKFIRKYLDDEMIKRCIRLASSQTGSTPYQIQCALLKDLSRLEKGVIGSQNHGSNSYAIHRIVSQYVYEAFSSLSINRTKLIRLQSILSESNNTTRIIYVPTHFSSLDGLILCNTLDKYNLPIPQAIAEGSDQLVSYQALNGNTILKKRALNINELGSPSIRQSMIITYLSQVLKMGGSIALFLDPSPIYANNDGTGSNESLFSSLIERIQNSSDFGSVSIVPVTMNYEVTLDQHHLIQEWSTPNSDQSQEKIALQMPSKVGAGYINFGAPIPVSSPKFSNDQLFGNELIGCTELKVRNIHLQSHILTPVNLLAVILTLFKNHDEELNFDHCRRLMRYLRTRVINLGHTVDWTDEEDVDVVLNHAIEMIGSEHIEIVPVKKHDIIKVNNSLNTGILLQLLVKPIAPIIAYEGIWYASYNICQQSSLSELKNCSNEMTRMPVPDQLPVFPNLDNIYEKFKVIVHTIQQSLPSFLPNSGFDSLNHHFGLINSQLEADDLMHIMDDLIILSSDPLRKQYLNMCLYLLNPILYSIHGTSLTLSDLTGVKQIPHSKLTQLVYQKNLEWQEGIQLYPELNSKPNIEIGLQVLKWWNVIKEIDVESSINSNKGPMINKMQEINWEVGNIQHLNDGILKYKMQKSQTNTPTRLTPDYQYSLLSTVYNWFNMNLPKNTLPSDLHISTTFTN